MYIQYPGSESASEDPKPWDFRPKVERGDGIRVRDFRFKDIWDALFVALEAAQSASMGSEIATLFFRMAYMKDHAKLIAPWAPTRLVTADREHPVQELGEMHLVSPWTYNPPVSVVQPINESVPDWGGMSFEAFLWYNDLLAWNEDCKYYYRDTEQDTKPWEGKETGRINTLLTHVSIIGLDGHHVKLSSLLDKFSRLRGVAPASNRECIETCAPHLVET